MKEETSAKRQVERYAVRKLEWLLMKAPESVCKATLAELRRGVGHIPGEMPRLWGILLETLPTEMQGKGMEPSREEYAIYTALTLFAVHQQGWDPRRHSMYRPGLSPGAAFARLVGGGGEAKERIERRFTQAATAADVTELAHHLRGLVQQLNAQGIPLDWGELAGQLYDYQFPERIAGVRLRWGEGFYAALSGFTQEDERKDGKQ